MFLDLPRDLIRSVARFRLPARTLKIEIATLTHNTSPSCDCNANDIQYEQHVLFHCTHPRVVSLRRTYASLFPPTGFDDGFFGPEKQEAFFSSLMIAFL